MSDATSAPPPYASTTAETSTSAYTSPPPQPVPISQLNAQAQAQALAQKTGPTPLFPDSHGIAHVRSRPGCFMILLMCPFPYLCLGCCLSHSSNMDLNESKQMITIESWPGYLRCCGSGKITISYSEIANFIAYPVNMTINKQSAYRGAVITRNGTVYKLTEPEVLTTLAPRIIEWQRFVFGRHPQSTWKPPDKYELIYTPAPSS